jgi:hypothetical protein
VTAPLAIRIDQLSLPAGTPREAERVAAAMQASLESLFAEDRALGLAWDGSIDEIVLDLPDGRSCEQTGAAIARAIRDRLASPERTR